MYFFIKADNVNEIFNMTTNQDMIVELVTPAGDRKKISELEQYYVFNPMM
jgi:hypothetical protein